MHCSSMFYFETKNFIIFYKFKFYTVHENELKNLYFYAITLA